MVNVYVFDITNICIHVKELLSKFTFHQKYRKGSHCKADVRDVWIVDFGTIGWDFLSVSNQLGKFSMETVISGHWWRSHRSLACKVLLIFSDSVLCLEKMNQIPLSNTVWERQLEWSKDSSQYRTLDTIDGEPMGFEWNIFPGSSTLELVREVQKFMSKMCDPDQFQGRIIFMSMFNDIIWGYKDNETECIANSTFVSSFAKRFPAGRWSFLGLGSEKSGTPLTKKDQEENGIESLNWWWSNSEKADTQFSEPRVRCLEHSKAKEGENYLYISVPMVIRLKLFFAQLFLSISSISLICLASTGRLVVAEQSDPFFAPADSLIMTPTLLIEISAQENLLQKHKERMENFPQPDRLMKICTDAGFLKTVKIGQYFMTKHTDEFLQFAELVTCRECALPRDDRSTDPNGWIQVNTKIGPAR